MPAFGRSLDMEQIEAIVRYIRNLEADRRGLVSRRGRCRRRGCLLRARSCSSSSAAAGAHQPAAARAPIRTSTSAAGSRHARRPTRCPSATATGEPRGIRVDLAQAIADRLGVALRVEWVTESVQRRRVGCDLVARRVPRLPGAQGRARDPDRPLPAHGRGAGAAAGPRPVERLEDVPEGARIAVLVRSLAQAVLGTAGHHGRPVRLRGRDAGGRGARARRRGRRHAGQHRLVQPQHPGPAARDRPPLRARARSSPGSWRSACAAASGRSAAQVDGIVGGMLTDGTVARIYAAYGVEHRPPRH